MKDLINELLLYNASLNIDKDLLALRNEYRENGIPTILIDGLNELCLLVSIKKPKKILELGTSYGCSTIAMAKCSSKSVITTIELNEKNAQIAKENFKHFQIDKRINCIVGDVQEVINDIFEKYDFIFLDCNKSKYITLLPKLKRILKKGGVIFADNVLFRGYITEKETCPKRYRTIKNRLTEFLHAISKDEDFITTILEIGDGISISYKKR